MVISWNKFAKSYTRSLWHDYEMETLKKKEIVSLLIAVLYNYGMIYYVNHFSLIIFYHSVWLGFELFGSSCRSTYSEYSSHSCAEDMTITIVIIKTPDRKWFWDGNDVMPGSDGLRIWWFWKRRLLRSDSGPGQSSEGLRDAQRVCWVR